MARMTLEQIKAARPLIDRAMIDATTEIEIAQQMVQDGDDPQAEPGIFVEDFQPAGVRAQLGMSQTEFAAALTIPVATLRNWEQGRVSPDPAARALLRIVARDPNFALSALNGRKSQL